MVNASIAYFSTLHIETIPIMGFPFFFFELALVTDQYMAFCHDSKFSVEKSKPLGGGCGDETK